MNGNPEFLVGKLHPWDGRWNQVRVRVGKSDSAHEIRYPCRSCLGLDLEHMVSFPSTPYPST